MKKLGNEFGIDAEKGFCEEIEDIVGDDGLEIKTLAMKAKDNGNGCGKRKNF